MTRRLRSALPPPPPLREPHPFAAAAPALPHPTSLSKSFTALFLRRVKDDGGEAEGGTRNAERGDRGDRGVGPSPGARFANAREYSAYHRGLLLDDAAGAARDSFPDRGAGGGSRWRTRGDHSPAAVDALARASAAATIHLVFVREFGGDARPAPRAASAASAAAPPAVVSADDVVEITLAPPAAASDPSPGVGAAAAAAADRGVSRSRLSTPCVGVASRAPEDGSHLGVDVLASDAAALHAQLARGGVAVRIRAGHSLVTHRRAFEAAHRAPPLLIAPLLAPLLTCEPFYAARNAVPGSRAVTGGSNLPGTTHEAARLPLDVGKAPRNAGEVADAIGRWRRAGRFNDAQARAIARCVRPGALDDHRRRGDAKKKKKNRKDDLEGMKKKKKKEEATSPSATTVRECAGVAIVHGPPGTGKTSALVGAVSALLLCAPAPRILACAPSHAATDELCARLAKGRLAADGEVVGMAPGEIIRVGAPGEISAAVTPYSLDALVDANLRGYARGGGGGGGGGGGEPIGVDGNRTRGLFFSSSSETSEARQRVSLLRGASVVACTLSAAGSDSLRAFEFDALVVDEAAQSAESATLAPLLRRADRVKRVVLAGDHKQLPAVAFARSEPSRRAFGVSLFERLRVGAGGANAHPSVTLDAQRRMHPSIRSFPSRFFYDARVVDAADAPTRSPFPLAEAAAARGACFDGDDRDDDDANHENRRVVTIASDGLAIALGAYRFLDVSSLSPSESRGGGEGGEGGGGGGGGEGGGGGGGHPPSPPRLTLPRQHPPLPFVTRARRTRWSRRLPPLRTTPSPGRRWR